MNQSFSPTDQSGNSVCAKVGGFCLGLLVLGVLPSAFTIAVDATMEAGLASWRARTSRGEAHKFHQLSLPVVDKVSRTNR